MVDEIISKETVAKCRDLITATVEVIIEETDTPVEAMAVASMVHAHMICVLGRDDVDNVIGQLAADATFMRSFLERWVKQEKENR